jgi:hypothetical protein
MGVKIGHISFSMRERSMETAFSQRLDDPTKWIVPYMCVWAMPFGLAGHCGWLAGLASPGHLDIRCIAI